MKYINFKRYKFSTIFRNINFKRYNFSKILKFIDPNRLNLKKFLKYPDITRFEFNKFFKLKTYNIRRIKSIDFFVSKFLTIHLPAAIIFFGFLYVFIPIFYSYDKTHIVNSICKNKNIECLIKGKVSYNFFPTPRLQIKDLIVNDLTKKKRNLITVTDSSIELSIKNLLAKDRHKFKKIKLNNYEINLNLKNLKEYKKLIKKKINLVPIYFLKGQIILFDGKDYVATIKNANIDLFFDDKSKEAELKGKFLDDVIYFSLDSKKIDNKLSTDVLFKMQNVNFLAKANLTSSDKEKNIIKGNILIKKDKNRFTGIVNYKDNEVTINKSNLRNVFLDGKLEGKIKILPYFSFDLDLSLNSLNFTKLYSHFLALDINKQKNLFKINKKINGKLSLSSNKIYSSHNLVNSFESRIKLNNGNILIEQFLVNLGKLGAADLLGEIQNDEKFTNFKYESNIFIENEKKFKSKFSIYNKEKIPANLYISGNFDLKNIKSNIYEISHSEKLSSEDINFIEEQFNDYMLSEDYKNLFRFRKFKEFLKVAINSEE